MGTPTEWLERLKQATDYGQLREAFAAMSSAARTTTQPETLVAAIDEAIERIRQERTRDEAQLKASQGEYESFRGKQVGVVGWLKRHTPFTETRKQDKDHRAGVAEQEAQILADDLTIARAEMLKESLLPAEARRVGADRGDWQRRLAAAEAPARVRSFAEALAALQRELKTATGFLDEIRLGVEAFAKARFPGDADHRQSEVDLRAARQELSDLERGVREKTDLRGEGVGRLRALITDDLRRSDPAFRTLAQRVTDLEAAGERAKGCASGVEALETAWKDLQRAATDLEALAERKRKAGEDEDRLREDAERADRRRSHAQAVAAEYVTKVEVCRDAVARAEAALAAARAVGQAGSTPDAGGVLAAQQALEAAQAAHRVAVATHESARSESRDAERQAREASGRLEDRRRESARLAEEEGALRRRLTEAREQVRRVAPATAEGLDALGEAAARIGRRPSLEGGGDTLRKRVPDADAGDRVEEARDLAEHADFLSRLAEAVRSEQKALEEALAEERRQREAAWSRHAQELLGDALASEVL